MDHHTAATSKSNPTLRYSSLAITEMFAEFDTGKF
jgi:hypothetical protein